MDLDKLREIAGAPFRPDRQIKYSNNKEEEYKVSVPQTVNENCGMSHEDEETVSDDNISCPMCQQEMPRSMFYDHMMSMHPCNMMNQRNMDQPEDEEEQHQFKKGQRVMYKGQPHVVEVPDAQADFVGIVPVGQEGNKEAVDLVRAHKLSVLEDEETEITLSFESKTNTMEGAEDATVWNQVGSDTDESPESPNNDDTRKVEVPANIKTLLKQEIVQLRAEAKKIEFRDKERSIFYDNSANVMEVILKHLETGTSEALKRAQIDISKLMGPILQRIPDPVWDFIVRGGMPKTLNDLFHEVKMKK